MSARSAVAPSWSRSPYETWPPQQHLVLIPPYEDLLGSASAVPSRAIMEVLGHSGISVTMNTYAHVLPALRQEAADAMDELFRA